MLAGRPVVCRHLIALLRVILPRRWLVPGWPSLAGWLAIVGSIVLGPGADGTRWHGGVLSLHLWLGDAPPVVVHGRPHFSWMLAWTAGVLLLGQHWLRHVRRCLFWDVAVVLAADEEEPGQEAEEGDAGCSTCQLEPSLRIASERALTNTTYDSTDNGAHGGRGRGRRSRCGSLRS
jgi:hypothetical protein